jgi:hypothetical protein
MSKNRNPKYALQFTEKELVHLHNALSVYDTAFSALVDNDDPSFSERWNELGKMIKSVEKVIDSID